MADLDIGISYAGDKELLRKRRTMFPEIDLLLAVQELLAACGVDRGSFEFTVVGSVKTGIDVRGCLISRVSCDSSYLYFGLKFRLIESKEWRGAYLRLLLDDCLVDSKTLFSRLRELAGDGRGQRWTVLLSKTEKE
jgi:hypothetical protein